LKGPISSSRILTDVLAAIGYRIRGIGSRIPDMRPNQSIQMLGMPTHGSCMMISMIFDRHISSHLQWRHRPQHWWPETLLTGIPCYPRVHVHPSRWGDHPAALDLATISQTSHSNVDHAGRSCNFHSNCFLTRILQE
jgi:hypothetical protein